MTDIASLPSGGPTREEIAKVEIGQTTVSPAVERGLSGFFLVLILAVPAIEIAVSQWGLRPGALPVWSTLVDIPERAAAAIADTVARGNASAWQRTVAANRATMSALIEFEDALEGESVVGRALRPRAQHLLSGWPGGGNERVYIGRTADDGRRWLYYRPDVEYLTNRGFLEDDVLRRRIESTGESTPPEPDPRPAILSFNRELAARGIRLVVVPTPVKPAVHPEYLSPSTEELEGPLQNRSYPGFVRWLEQHGVQVFDASRPLDEGGTAGPHYLATDTHWRPEAMQTVAVALANYIQQHVSLPHLARPPYQLEDRRAANVGDTVAMLGLPDRQEAYARETVQLKRVASADYESWRPDRTADVLVLGDSFSNIYSLASLGWGESAGFVEHLSYALGRPVDRIVQNGDGAHATRALLRAEGPGRLAGKKVVIWQFAVRELTSGDWKIIP
jgi:alginate O-acetyltransferase complex protein AlgJ